MCLPFSSSCWLPHLASCGSCCQDLLSRAGLTEPVRIFPVNQNSESFNSDTRAGSSCCVFLSTILVCAWTCGELEDFKVLLSHQSGEQQLKHLLLRASVLAKLWDRKRLRVPGMADTNHIAIEELRMWVLYGRDDEASSLKRHEDVQLAWMEHAKLRMLLQSLAVSRVHEGTLASAVQFLDKDWTDELQTNSCSRDIQDSTDGVSSPSSPRSCGYIFIAAGKAFSVMGLQRAGAFFSYDSHVLNDRHLEQSAAIATDCVEDLLQHLPVGCNVFFTLFRVVSLSSLGLWTISGNTDNKHIPMPLQCLPSSLGSNLCNLAGLPELMIPWTTAQSSSSAK